MIPAPEQTTGGEAGPARERAVFVSDFVHVDVPYEELATAFSDESVGWLQSLARLQRAKGDDLPQSEGRVVPTGIGRANASLARSPGLDSQTTVVVRIGTTGGGPAPVVAVSVGAPRIWEGRIVIAMTWTPVSFGQLLPSLDADVELTDLGAGTSRIGLSGRYRVPLGQIGRGIDRLGLHRVAESSIREFLLEIEKAVHPR